MSTDKPGTEEGLGPPAAGSLCAERLLRWITENAYHTPIDEFATGLGAVWLSFCFDHDLNPFMELDAILKSFPLTEALGTKVPEWARRSARGNAAQPPSESVAAVRDDRQEGKPGDIRTGAIRDCAAVARNTGREYERDKRRAKLAGDNEEVLFLDGMVKACARVAAKLDDLTVPKALTPERIEDDIQF